MKFPADCDTSEKKYQYTCKAQEEARILYNLFSKWSDKGITQQEYDKISPKIKQNYPYKERLEPENWVKFFKQYKNWSNEISMELGTQRAKTERDYASLVIWDIDIGDI